MASQMSPLKWINLALRGILEVSIVIAFGFWGYRIAESAILKLVACIVAPLIGFGFWGLFDFHQFGRLAEPLRLLQELLISGMAAYALYVSGMPKLGWTLGIISVIHHGLVYLLGNRLLKQRL